MLIEDGSQTRSLCLNVAVEDGDGKEVFRWCSHVCCSLLVWYQDELLNLPAQESGSNPLLVRVVQELANPFWYFWEISGRAALEAQEVY